jgi:hypothetical protein
LEIQQYQRRHNNKVVNGLETFDSTGTGQWVFLTGQIGVQATGSATSLMLQIERSTLDPQGSKGPNPAPVDNITVQGNPLQGMVPLGYFEPSSAWWRVRVLEVIGGSVLITISGPVGGDIVR